VPRIFDNIDQHLLQSLRGTLLKSERSDFCVGYFNLRGWKRIDDLIENWSGTEDKCCRLMIGMQKLPQDLLKDALSFLDNKGVIDAQKAVQLRKQLGEEFRKQLMLGAPNNEDEAGLHRLAKQIREKKVIVKLFLRHPLHAKLYLAFRQDSDNPITGYVGSSNLTLAGLSEQGELNVDVLDQDACKKLAKWFNDRWNDNRCIDISLELVDVIENSWARPEIIPPYYIYLKMAYHLAQEARTGLAEFKLPIDLQNKLLDFQTAAVKIAAHHINKRNGVLIGDVVGLGKTLMATAVARVLEEDFNLETLIICPKNLTRMWEGYVHAYHLRAKVLSISKVLGELKDLRRYRLLILDESQNLRNKEGKKYKAIQEYIKDNDSKVILLSATPFNKNYLDLSSQLQLFVPNEMDLGIRPELLIGEIGEINFAKYQILPRSLAAFEKSEYPDDWRELMRLYMVRRTRSFIKANYASTDHSTDRKYLIFSDGRRSYFPNRNPKTVRFSLNEKNKKDQYARLYSEKVVDIINNLNLPRYGLGNFVLPDAKTTASPDENKQIDNLSRAGKRLMGFCRTNLFKRLESSGQAFLLSIDRHIIRNYVYIHAIENGLPLPIGIQSAELLDTGVNDEDLDTTSSLQAAFDYESDTEDEKDSSAEKVNKHAYTCEWYAGRAEQLYQQYKKYQARQFKWARPTLFNETLRNALLADVNNLMKLLNEFGEWDPANDTKLNSLENLISTNHPGEKVLIFTQFADTVSYLAEQLRSRKIAQLEGVTGQSEDPTDSAWRFSPVSNEKKVEPGKEIRVLIATDVLSEGQNLQDCAVVVNYDLPWALVRLIQRVGRVDRIGQKAENIYCYSFLPADGLEKIIRLRERVRRRLAQNGEVVGSDEQFFEDDLKSGILKDLYTEKSGILDGESDNEVDLASFAYQIWHNATQDDPGLAKKIEDLPDVVYSTKELIPTEKAPNGVLVYMKTAEGNDSLAWINKKGESVTQSQIAVLRAAECQLDTPGIPKNPQHHSLVEQGVRHLIQQEKTVGGQLGRTSGAKYRSYERLKKYYDDKKKHEPLFVSDELERAITDIYRFPLRQSATDSINRQLKAGISDDDLAELVMGLRSEDRLSLKEDEIETQEPRIICSMGLFQNDGGQVK
jgi:superfamily II DNA or RNA helicase